MTLGKALPIMLFSLAAAAAFAAPARADDDQPGYSIEDVTACSQDAMRLCRDKLPDIDAIETCMKAHFDELKPKCKARFNR